MDAFYLSHGGPNVSLDDSLPARAFFKSWRTKVLTAAPKAILMISGHWDTTVPTVNVINGPNPTIYDFGGLPREYYQIKYPAPGAPALARRVKELVEKAGFGPVKEDKKRGLDHGAWVPLYLMYPEADIPVCQLSVQSHRDATYHYNLGKALAPLRDQGILVLGSGAATHNMRAMHLQGGPLLKWAVDFDTWVKDSLLAGRHEDVNQYEVKAPYAKMAHPWPDHFLPLHVALGAAGEEAKAELIHHSWTYRSLSWASYRFSTAD